MSNTKENILTLLKALKVLKDLPYTKLAENGQLVSEIQAVTSGHALNSLVEDLRRDFRNEQNLKFSQELQTKKSNLTHESPEFLHSYTRYQAATFKHLNENTKTKARITSPMERKEAVAFNSRKTNPFKTKEIKTLKEAKEFESVFNSIYSDRSLQIGTAQDPTQISSYIDYSPYSWNYKDYLAIPTLSNTIDLPIQIATRQMPIIDFDDNKLQDEISKTLKRMRFNEIVQKMLLYSGLSPRGSLIVPITNEDKTIRFNVFNDTQFTYATSYQYSRIDFTETLTGVSTLYVLGHMIQNEVTGHFLCPGFEPLYAIGKNRIYQLKDAAEAVNIYLYTIKVLCIRAQVMVQQWGGEGQNDTLLQQMQNLTDDINSSLSLSTALKMPEGASLEILNNNLNEGFAKVSPIIKEYQGMLSGVMPDYFYGSTTAYAANNFNIHATHQNIRSQIQEAQIEPIYRFAINKLLSMDTRFAKYKSLENDFDIDFESLYEPTSVEKADLESKRIDNIIKMADYPELQEIFKKEELLDDSVTIPEREKEEDIPPGQTGKETEGEGID